MSQRRKATIAFPVGLHRQLSRIARRKHVTLSALVRATCESRYGILAGAGRHAVRDVVRMGSGDVSGSYLE